MSMAKSRNSWTFLVMAGLSLIIGAYALRFFAVPFGHWLLVDADIRNVIMAVPFVALSHMIVAPIALIAGGLQIIPALRMRWPLFHRWTGRTYMVACIYAGIAGLLTAPHVSGGVIAATGFTILAVLWLVTSILAWRAAWVGDYAQHRKLVAYSFALTFAAVTYRLHLAIGFAINPDAHYSDLSRWASFTAWIPNLIAVWMYQRIRSRRAIAA